MTSDSLAADQPDAVPFSVKLGHPAEVLLHGVNIAADLSGLSIVAEGREIPEVVLRLAKNAAQRVEFEGLAHVVIGEVVTDPGPAAAMFLDAIDAAELEKAALHRADLGTDRHALTAAMLRQLVEWANGRS